MTIFVSPTCYLSAQNAQRRRKSLTVVCAFSLTHCSSWCRSAQLKVWEFDEKSFEDAKKKNKAKSYQQGLEEAMEWFNSDKVFPVPGKAAAKSESKATNKPEDKKRKAKDPEADAPPTKKPKKAAATVVHDDDLSESEEDAPYKIPFPDPKKARRVRVMRKLGLYPPEGSLFKAQAPHA